MPTPKTGSCAASCGTIITRRPDLLWHATPGTMLRGLARYLQVTIRVPATKRRIGYLVQLPHGPGFELPRYRPNLRFIPNSNRPSGSQLQAIRISLPYGHALSKLEDSNRF
jgi:hypothetical protein